MRRIILIGLTLALAGCGANEPSEDEIARGMKETYVREMGAYSYAGNLRATARKIGNGRWAVQLIGEKNGEQKTLNATAVMDKDGSIHYYTD